MHHHDWHVHVLALSTGASDVLAHHGPTIISFTALVCTLLSTGCTLTRLIVDLRRPR